MSEKSPPDEKWSPSPRTSTARTESSRSISRHTDARSRCIWASAALRCLGFEMMISSTPGPGSTKVRWGKRSVYVWSGIVVAACVDIGALRVSASLVTSRVRDGFFADHRQYIVTRHDLTVLICDLGVPTHLTESLVGAQCLLLARETDLDAITRLDGLGESQAINTVVGEHRAVRRVDEQPGCRGDQEVPVRNAPAKQGIATRGLLAHVGVELVAGKFRKTLDVSDRDFALRGIERIADLKCAKRLSERVYSRIQLRGSFQPPACYRRNHTRR